MSECIRINSTEHLPVEQTLLIHYSILCTGTWDLVQLSTAYRNVCDNEWAVMYPNHQHPRHTDFPIVVTNGVYNATFAWNYGGILGISPENFDDGHSYLTQLTIFEYGCIYTGNTGLSGQSGNSGNSNTGQTGNTGIYIPPIGGGGPRPFPAPAAPPWPEPPGVPGGTPDPFGTSPPRVSFPDPFGSGEPTGQTGLQPYNGWVRVDPNEIGTVHVSVRSNNTVVNNRPIIISNPFIPNVYNNWDPINSAGLQTPIRTNQSQIPIINVGVISDPISIRSDNRPAGPSNPYIYNNQAAAITTEAINFGANNINFGNIDITMVSPSQNVASRPGGLTSTNINDRSISIENGISLRQLDTSRILPSSFTTIEINDDEIPIGSPIICNGIFLPPENQQLPDLTAQLYTLTSGGNARLIATSSSSLVSRSSPLRIAISADTSRYDTGQLTILLLIKDSNNIIIGISSKMVAIRPTNFNTGNNQTVNSIISNITRGDDLPASIRYLNQPIDNDPLLLNSNNSTFIILTPTSGHSGNFSTVLVNGNNSGTFIIDTYYQSGMSGSSMLGYTSIASSSTPLMLDNVEIRPDMHSVGLSNINTTINNNQNNNIIMSVSPIHSPIENARLYIGNSYSLIPFSGSVSSSTVTVQTPYAFQAFRLIVHGAESGYIPYNYSYKQSSTNISGVCIFTGVSINKDDYYSIVIEGTSNFNPFKDTVYTNKY